MSRKRVVSTRVIPPQPSSWVGADAARDRAALHAPQVLPR